MPGSEKKILAFVIFSSLCQRWCGRNRNSLQTEANGSLGNRKPSSSACLVCLYVCLFGLFVCLFVCLFVFTFLLFSFFLLSFPPLSLSSPPSSFFPLISLLPPLLFSCFLSCFLDCCLLLLFRFLICLYLAIVFFHPQSPPPPKLVPSNDPSGQQSP